jgi:hypothetical protein
MKAATLLAEEDLIRRAVSALMDQLGPVETARFLGLPARRRMDSVKRHRKWQSSLDRDAFFTEAFGPTG